MNNIVNEIISYENTDEVLNIETIFQHDFYQKLIEDSMDGHLLFSTDTGRILYLSERSKNLLGYKNKNNLKINIWDIISADEHSLFKERINARIEDKTLIPDRRIYTIIKYDQSTFRAEVLASKMIIERRMYIHVILRDISAHEKFLRQIDYIQRMETTAALTKGLLFSVDNAVEEVKRNIRYLEKKSKSNADLLNHISSIKGSTTLLSQSIRRLHDFAKGGEPDPRQLNLNDFIKSLLPSARMKIRPDIHIASCISDKKLNINADPDQIQLAVFSIIANSEESIEKNGLIKISTSKKKLTKEDCIADPFMIPGTFGCIRIEDNGAGMDKKIMNNIGEPFFTTKFQGRGLGLASVYGIIKRHKGKLSIVSEPGIGTIVRIYLKIVK